MPLLTMIFTDVVGSSATKRDISLGRDNRERDQAYLEKVQARHFELVRESCRAFGGQEVSTMGDAFFLAFEDPVQAIRCASDIQKKLAANPIETPLGPLRLRIGLHSGFPEYFERSWHGTDVDTTARVEAAASPQQILISSRTFELVRHMTDAKFHACGQFELKGVGRISLWEVDWDGKGPKKTAAPSLDAALRRKRILRISWMATAAVLVIGAGSYAYLRYRATGTVWPTKPRASVAVMGFKNLGKPEVEWLSNALTEMLSTELGSNDALRTISAEDVSDVRTDLAIVSFPVINSATLTKIRHILHSEYIISGSYFAEGNQPTDKIRVDISVQDVESGEALTPFYEEGTIGTVSETLRKVSADIRSRIGVQEPQPSTAAKSKPALPANTEALRLYSEGVEKLRRFDAMGAKEKLEKAIQIDSDRAVPHLAMAQTLQLLGYDQAAREQAKKAVELSGELSPEQRRAIEAWYFELSSDWEKAKENYHALKVLYPDNPDYALDVARVQTNGGKAEEALTTLSELSAKPQMKDDPRVDYSVALADASLSRINEQRDAALSAAEKAKQQGSRLLEAHAYWQLCSAYSDLGEYEKGEQACSQSSLAAPIDDVIKARSTTVLANIFVAQGRTDEALQMRREALAIARKVGSQKDEAGALQNLANLVDSQGNAKQAREYYEEAIKVSTEIGDSLGLAGIESAFADQLYQQGDFSKAEDMYRKSIVLARQIQNSAGEASALQGLSALQSAQGKLAEAQKSLEQAISLQKEAGLEPERANGLAMLGDILYERGDLDNARKSYEESMKLASAQKAAATVATCQLGLASIDLEQRKFADAEKQSREAAETFAQQKMVDNEAGARDTTAQSFLEENKFAEAKEELDRALKLQPRDQPTRLSLMVTDARLKTKQGQNAEAQNELASALRETEKLKLISSSLKIRLAQAEMERAKNPKLAEQHLHAIESEAREKGYLRLASEAHRGLTVAL